MRKDTLHPVVILLPTKTHGQVMNDSEKKCTKDYWLGSLVEPIRGGACKTHESCQDLTMCYDDLLILYASFYLSSK